VRDVRSFPPTEVDEKQVAAVEDIERLPAHARTDFAEDWRIEAFGRILIDVDRCKIREMHLLTSVPIPLERLQLVPKGRRELTIPVVSNKNLLLKDVLCRHTVDHISNFLR
jgi:hypothetical protein